jgi:hypothetical protein
MNPVNDFNDSDDEPASLSGSSEFNTKIRIYTPTDSKLTYDNKEIIPLPDKPATLKSIKIEEDLSSFSEESSAPELLYPYDSIEPGILLALNIPLYELEMLRNQEKADPKYFLNLNHSLASMFSLAFNNDYGGHFLNSCVYVYHITRRYAKIFKKRNPGDIRRHLLKTLEKIYTSRLVAHRQELEIPTCKYCYFYDKLEKNYTVYKISYELTSFVSRLILVLKGILYAYPESKKRRTKTQEGKKTKFNPLDRFLAFKEENDRILFYYYGFMALAKQICVVKTIRELAEYRANSITQATADAENFAMSLGRRF